MKLLLTSGGVKNASMRDALAGLLGKPIAECSALIIPTAIYALTRGAQLGWQQISGTASSTMCELEWKSMGVLELTALPSIKKDVWAPMLQQTDALLVGGGDPLYLTYWMRQSGLAALLPSLRPQMVYVGLSAGSMVMGPSFGGETYGGIAPTVDDDSGLGAVDFAMFPHLDHPMLPENTMAHAEEWAAKLAIPTYAIDDETAIRVVDGAVDVITEGQWKLLGA